MEVSSLGGSLPFVCDYNITTDKVGKSKHLRTV